MHQLLSPLVSFTRRTGPGGKSNQLLGSTPVWRRKRREEMNQLMQMTALTLTTRAASEARPLR